MGNFNGMGAVSGGAQGATAGTMAMPGWGTLIGGILGALQGGFTGGGQKKSSGQQMTGADIYDSGGFGGGDSVGGTAGAGGMPGGMDIMGALGGGMAQGLPDILGMRGRGGGMGGGQPMSLPPPGQGTPMPQGKAPDLRSHLVEDLPYGAEDEQMRLLKRRMLGNVG
jgi:hypothetical protein